MKIISTKTGAGIESIAVTRCLAAAGLVAVLTLVGCSGGDHEVPSAGGTAEIGTTNDINSQDPATLQQGGNLRLALADFPSNFNVLQIDGYEAENVAMQEATLPRPFRINADGRATLDTDYFTSVKLTSVEPQVVTYTINPKAVWSDGTPITWRDIAAQIRATCGKDKRFHIAGPHGADRVESVTRGVDDRQAVVKFAKHYAEWQGMFDVLLPQSMTVTPEAFNTAQLNGPGPSAGPFIITTLDKTARRIILSRNPRWWGTLPLLDSITYLVLDDAARLPALQNNTIDATGVDSLDELTVARRTPGISIRRAPADSWYQFTFNGAPGSILADPALRIAVAKSIDRQSIANVTLRGLADKPAPLNNHVFLAGQEGYQDNSGVVAYDPHKAMQELDGMGWRLNGQFREKGGRQLVIRDVLYDSRTAREVGAIAQNNLAKIGVKLDLDVRPAEGFFENVIPGDFDVAQFGWVGGAFPLGGLAEIYGFSGESNFGKIGSQEIDQKIEQTLEELDPGHARDLANEVDQLVWAEGFSLPLTQSDGNIAVRSTLANFGAFGLADADYTKIGFMKQ